MRLKLVTTTIPTNDYELYIKEGDNGNPVLAYKDGDAEIEVTCSDASLVKCSTLEELLSDYSICDTKFIISTYSPTLYYLIPDPSLFNPENNFIPTLDTAALDRGEVSGFKISGITGSTRSIKVCDNWYDNIREQEDAEKAINTAASGISTAIHDKLGEYSYDIEDSSVVIKLVSETTYTDTVSLEEWIWKLGKPGVTAKLDVSYMYSIGDKIYGGMQNIQAFRYLDSGDLSITNSIMDLGKVQLEYIGGVLKIYPKDTEIGEAIINSCIMSAGNLNA